jgi:hypothetical protein
MPQLFDQLRDFLAEVENEKQASVRKRAEANTETTSQGGPTSHPSKSQDDGTLPATEGKRSQENTGDVKDTIPAGGVDASSEKGPSQADQQHNVGITSTATGEDPSNEDNYKEKKEDPGTGHAAKAGEGEKYSSLSFGELRKLASYKADDILSDITSIIKQAEDEMSESAKKKHEESETADEEEVEEKAKDKAKSEGILDSKGNFTGKAKTAAAAGYAAATLTEEQNSELVKTAHAAISSSIEATIADGLEKAAMVGAYLQSFYKAAAEGEAAGGEGEAQESPEHEQLESPGQEMSEEGGMDVDPAMLSQMAGQEAAPEGMPQGAPEGGAPDANAVQELLMALQEQGIEPEQLLQMIEGGQGGQGDVGAEAPKMASARVNPETVELVKLVKHANSVRKAQIKAGKFRVTEAKTAAQKALRDQIKACVRDIIG